MNVSVGNRRLAGKSAIVTGAGKGIGRAIAERFAQEGADLVVVDVNADALARTCEGLRAHGVEVIDQVADMTAESAANLAAETALSQFGKIDILINNVGGNTPGRIWEMPVEEWDRIIAFNLRPTLLCTRAVAPAMIRQRAGHIVCISSGAREGAPWLAARGAAAYSTAKAGLHGFVRDMCFELGEYGVTINAIAAGAIATEKLTPYFEELDATDPYSPQRLTPLKRLGQPREIANAALFLASDEASYITGTTLNVNGGR